MGIPYGDLVRDLATAPQLNGFKLEDAAGRPPKGPNGLNIEGLCASPRGGLLIGFRNPIPQGRALLIPLENPEEVILGKRARLGNPISLPLGGLGIRAIAYVETQGIYLIIAGPPGQEAIFELYQWSGDPKAPLTLLDGVSFNGLQTEGLVVFPSAFRRPGRYLCEQFDTREPQETQSAGLRSRRNGDVPFRSCGCLLLEQR